MVEKVAGNRMINMGREVRPKFGSKRIKVDVRFYKDYVSYVVVT
jgi:hypothetical protein